MSSSGQDGLFDGLFGRGEGGAGDRDWLQAMLDTEAALARALERAGLAVAGAGAAVTAAARAEHFSTTELGRQATLTGNPVPALVRALSAQLPAGPFGDAVHRGATSQDILDTAAMLLARKGIDAVLASLAACARGAAALAAEHAGTVMAGRTLLQQAVPVTFGLVAAGWLAALDDAGDDLLRVRGRLAVQFGGAAGTLASLGEHGPAVSALLAEELSLAEPVLPWHTDRLRIIQLASALAGACAVLGKIARDVTLLAETEIAEVSEGTGPGHGGSSAMPHKRNPVASIVILGCAKRVPGLLVTLTAAAEQELQRAAGAWHAEWEPLADLLRLASSAAAWGADLLSGLSVDAARMRANLDSAGGLPLAEQVAALLAPALGRLPAHDLVATAAAVAAGRGISLPDALLADQSAAALLAGAGLGRPELEAATAAASSLGSAGEFVRRALAAHARAGFTAPANTGQKERDTASGR